ncbi:MAG: HAMP domain-containing histidine kinase [Actinomycetota bacterium]|nr:HAMP domain-containing histidine kinase [Actinomycetota bacterium]
MTLRLRLVLALVALVLVGLGLFGFATYSLYSRSQYQRLDDQLRASAPFATRRLEVTAGLSDPGARVVDNTPGPDANSGRPPLGALASYDQLRDGAGKVIATNTIPSSSAKPRLASQIEPGPSRFFETGSVSGSGRWRVYVSGTREAGGVLLIAAPLDEVANALNRLILIETSGGAALLAILCVGSWLILRRGLRPLERMAGTAGEITAGDLSKRVAPASSSTEVGRLGGALNTMLDEIQRAFAERDATELRLRQFLSDASHELRTPLTSIQGFAELFRMGGEDKVDLATILRRIEEESARMKVLVEDLLLLARLDETRPIERAPVDLAVLAADACSDAVAAAPDRHVTLDAPEPVVMLGDQALLRQAVANLVANAVRHTPAGTAMEVTARLDDRTAVLMVRDHGPGLEAEALDHVFDRFWQASKARTGASTGLGLSIVAAVAAEHGGTATATNAPGGGALFRLDLPLH